MAAIRFEDFCKSLHLLIRKAGNDVPGSQIRDIVAVLGINTVAAVAEDLGINFSSSDTEDEVKVSITSFNDNQWYPKAKICLLYRQIVRMMEERNKEKP